MRDLLKHESSTRIQRVVRLRTAARLCFRFLARRHGLQAQRRLELRVYKPSSRHLDRKSVRYAGEDSNADISDIRRQLNNTSAMLDKSADEYSRKSREDEELELEMMTSSIVSSDFKKTIRVRLQGPQVCREGRGSDASSSASSSSSCTRSCPSSRDGKNGERKRSAWRSELACGPGTSATILAHGSTTKATGGQTTETGFGATYDRDRERGPRQGLPT